jgi:hypothetical protein
MHEAWAYAIGFVGGGLIQGGVFTVGIMVSNKIRHLGAFHNLKARLVLQVALLGAVGMDIIVLLYRIGD